MKTAIIERLGQSDLLTPSLVAEGLAANDRVKVRLSVLQAAAAHGRDPKNVRFNLMDECRAAGIDHVPLETLVNHAELLAGERLLVPGLGNLVATMWDDMATMIRAVKAGDPVQGDDAPKRLSVKRM